MKNRVSLAVASLLLTTSVSAIEWGMTAGAHDFIVPDVQNDFTGDGLSAGDSHTL
jgi:hypothetical protein